MRFRLFGTLLFLLVSCICFSQTKTLTGKVKDATDGSEIPGATVLNKKTKVGVATDSNGEFSIAASVGDTLSFSFIGKKPVNQVVDNRNVIEVTMYDDIGMLEEVTVVAFGTQKKSSVVSSISTVKPSELRVPAANLTSALAGRIPGVISYQVTGEPGKDVAQFFVRGVTTFGYKSSPLILIDGFESSADELSKLQVDDIESFSILKDASATALYGSRAANGILLITTKIGREGKLRVNARVDTHVATPTKMIQTVDGVTYMRLFNEARITRNPAAGALYSEQQIRSTINNENPMVYPNVDWYDELFKNNTVNTKATLNLSGGGQIANYFISAGYDNENGLLKNDKRSSFNSSININRTHLRSNVVFKLTKTTTLDTRIQGEFERYNGPAVAASDIFGAVMDSNPVDFPPVYEPDEAHRYSTYTLFGNTIVNGNLKRNPYAQMVQGYQVQNNNVVTAMATLMQDLEMITPGLKFQAKGSVKTSAYTTQTRTYSPFYFHVERYNQVTQDYKLFALNPLTGNATVGDIMMNESRNVSYYFEGRLNWDRQYNKHNLSGMLVGTIQENANLVAGTLFEALPERNSNLAGRGTYNYDNRYFVEVGFGYNGSEKFTGVKRYGFFPTSGIAWAVSNEQFFKPLEKTVNNLKLRATYGMGGNDAIAQLKDRFFFLSSIERGGYSGGRDWANFTGYTWGQSFINEGSGYAILRYANPDITWEISHKLNLALETGLFKNSIRFTGEYFKEWRSRIYQVREMFAATTGLVDGDLRISGNVGKVEVQGFEFQGDYEKSFNKNLWLTGRANFTYSTNKVTAKDERRYADKYLSAIGQSINRMWGLVAERLFVDDAEIAHSPHQDWGNYQAGDIKYKDINGDGKVDKNDMIPMGYPTVPEIQYGFGLSAGYKNVDLSFFLQGNARVSFLINSTASNGGIAPLVNQRNALEIVANDYWTTTNPNVHAFWPRLSVEPLENNTQPSSWWLRDGSFLRMKSIECGYTFGGLKKIAMESARVYFSTENLFYISKFKLWDPEMGASGYGYPPNKRFNVGIQVSF